MTAYFRAARGNFGLVWALGKGLGRADYARWSLSAAGRWAAFANELEALTGVELELAQVGGLTMCLDEQDLTKRIADVEDIRASIGVPYPFEVLDPDALRRLSPYVGPDVVGAIFSPTDGHVSPLRLLRALVQGLRMRGGDLVSGVRCDCIEHKAGEFHVRTNGRTYVAGRVVLAAGLGNRALAPMVGLRASVSPNRGQILVSERMKPFIRHPSQLVRQTGEGVIQIGDSHEDVGLDDSTSVEELGRIAKTASRFYPVLSNVNVVRSWGALRVMTPDGFPIYQASERCPGAFVITCHSGITLASNHAGPLVDWIRGGAEPSDIRTFKSERFDV